MTTMQRILSTGDGRNLARSQNSFGRTALHVAVLAQHEDIVEQLAQNYPELLRIGDIVSFIINHNFFFFFRIKPLPTAKLKKFIIQKFYSNYIYTLQIIDGIVSTYYLYL